MSKTLTLRETVKLLDARAAALTAEISAANGACVAAYQASTPKSEALMGRIRDLSAEATRRHVAGVRVQGAANSFDSRTMTALVEHSEQQHAQGASVLALALALNETATSAVQALTVATRALEVFGNELDCDAAA